MRTLKREAKVNGERWFAEYSSVQMSMRMADGSKATTGNTPEDDAPFRFMLGRTWNVNKPPMMFIGLNPSTATHLADDRTVARCSRDAKRWGFGGMFMMNLFPYRATEPDQMKRFYESRHLCSQDTEVDSENINRNRIEKISLGCPVVCCAWGNHGKFKARGAMLYEELMDFYEKFKQPPPEFKCYLVTTQGEPNHPLYMGSKVELQPYSR